MGQLIAMDVQWGKSIYCPNRPPYFPWDLWFENLTRSFSTLESTSYGVGLQGTSQAGRKDMVADPLSRLLSEVTDSTDLDKEILDHNGEHFRTITLNAKATANDMPHTEKKDEHRLFARTEDGFIVSLTIGTLQYFKGIVQAKNSSHTNKTTTSRRSVEARYIDNITPCNAVLRLSPNTRRSAGRKKNMGHE